MRQISRLVASVICAAAIMAAPVVYVQYFPPTQVPGTAGQDWGLPRATPDPRFLPWPTGLAAPVRRGRRARVRDRPRVQRFQWLPDMWFWLSLELHRARHYWGWWWRWIWIRFTRAITHVNVVISPYAPISHNGGDGSSADELLINI